MIKRAVLWDEADDDSDEEITHHQQQKLERRLLPGAERGEDDEGSEEESADSDPPVPPEEPAFRGKFRCQLCPEKILINEKHMEVHLQSAYHKRNVHRFERAKVRGHRGFSRFWGSAPNPVEVAWAQAMGVEAFEAECLAKAEAREKASTMPSRKNQKNREFWQRRKAEKKAAKAKKKERKTVAAAGKGKVKKAQSKAAKEG
ncbi:unnamed protein product [Durusdinium trenchii]|uniref:Uncharacterized protein n=1 Tax=Durusdinium trenchii TaxID=1381693 RepID=A0ABP0L4A5_9DINO